MNKRTNRELLPVRIIIAVAIVAIFAASLFLYFGQESVAVQNAKEAYEQYLKENPSSKETDFIYIEAEGTIVAIRNGSVINKEFRTEAAAVKAATDNASTLSYTLSSTNSDKLYSVKLFDPNSSIFAVGAQKLAAGAVSMSVKVVSGGTIFAEFDIPAGAIANKQEPVEITISKIDPKANVSLGKNQEGFAYDIDVTNLAEGNTAEIGVTINGPKGLAQGEQAITVYHNSSRISSKYNPTSGQISFKTTSFSPYTFTYDVVEVTTLEELREQLSKKGGVNIRLAAPITIDMEEVREGAKGEYGDGYLYFGALVFGDKTIDLNGQTITYSGSRDENDSALFCVNNNASLTIVDSSNSGNGRVEVKFDTYAVWSVNPSSRVNIYDGIFVSDKYAGFTADTNAALVYSSGGKINVYGGYYLFDSANGGERNGFNVIDQAGTETYIWIYEGVHLSSADYCDAGDKDVRVVRVGEAGLVTGESTREIGTEAGAVAAWHTVKGQKIELDKTLNTDKYIYRVGNRNGFPLGAFFNQINAPTGSVSVRVVDILATKAHNEQVGKDYDKNDRFSGYYENIGDQYVNVTYKAGNTWDTSTVQIASSFTGPARLELYDTNTKAIYGQMYVEVVAANNVSTYSELKNASSVLLNNIKMSDGGSYALSGATLFGNGFTFDVTAGAVSGSNMSANYLVSLSSANLDNVQIVGPVYDDFSLTTGANYNRPTVLTQGTCGIYNSYISNAAAAIRLYKGKLTIVNSTVKGGSFANIDMRGGDLILDGVTTINQVSGNDTSASGKTTIGLGIVLWYEGTSGAETIQLVDVDGDGTKNLTQYNYIASSQLGSKYFASTAATAGLDDVLFSSNVDAKFKKDINGTTWVNAGILSINENVGKNSISTPNGYDWAGVRYSARDGHLCTVLAANYPADPSAMAPVYSPSAQYPIAPTLDWDYPEKAGDKNYIAKTDDPNYCYYDAETSTIMIRFEKEGSFDFDPRILSVTKFGKALSVAAIEMNGQKYTDKITFTKEGDYEITYTYVDDNNYAMGVGGIGSYSVIHKQTIKVNVVLQDKALEAPVFDFNGTVATTVQGNDNNVYLNVSNGALSKTVGGKTIKYPKIYVKLNSSLESTNDSTKPTKASSSTAYCPVFDGVVTITDNGTVYNSSTTTMADGRLDMITCKDKAYVGILDWGNGGTPPANNPTVVSNKLYFKSLTLQGVERNQTTYTFEYVYTAQNGDTYHYFVGYVFPAKGGSSCVTGDTLVTLADGSKKEIQYVTNEDLLMVWNHYTGKYETVPAAIIFDHGYDDNTVIKLNFSDGTQVKMINLHQFLDVDLDKYVSITADNVSEYVGHSFAKRSGDGYKTVTLESYEVSEEHIKAYGIISALHYNILVEDMISTDFMEGDYDLFNYFEIGDGLVYDATKMEEDIAKYGLYTYADFADYLTYEQFVGFNVQYFKIAVGKGLYTYEGILKLIDTYLKG